MGGSLSRAGCRCAAIPAINANAASQAISEANSLGTDNNATANNTLVTHTNVGASAGSVIRTRLLEVHADVPTLPLYSANAVRTGDSLFKGGDAVENRALTLSRLIDFNASVLMLGPLGPELVIDAAGNITRQVNIGVDALSPVIRVADIINTGATSGTMVFSIAPSALDTLSAVP